MPPLLMNIESATSIKVADPTVRVAQVKLPIRFDNVGVGDQVLVFRVMEDIGTCYAITCTALDVCWV